MFSTLLRRLRLARLLRHERAALDRIPATQPDTAALKKLTASDLAAIYNDAGLAKDWAEDSTALERVAVIEDMRTDGVNPGDRRALYYLVRALKPKRILEVGTNVGASTLNIAAALKRIAKDDIGLVTVDIRDVNDAADAYWKLAKLPRSPRGNIAELGMGPFVTFQTQSSLTYLDACRDTFDFIFLDGDHSAATVYQEIPKALRVLRPGGVILLHDFFPGNKPLWSNNAVIAGPQLACERLQAEGAALAVLPLGKLPWPTKLGSQVTSLALVSAR